jgi:hypothetical protein
VLTDAKINYFGDYYWKEKYGLDIFEQAPAVLQRLIDRFNEKRSSASDATDGLKFLSS